MPSVTPAQFSLIPASAVLEYHYSSTPYSTSWIGSGSGLSNSLGGSTRRGLLVHAGRDLVNQVAMAYINPLLLLILIAEVCFGICAARSPQFLRWLAAHLLARADVVELCNRESVRRKRFWLNELQASPSTTAAEDAKYGSAIQLLGTRWKSRP